MFTKVLEALGRAINLPTTNSHTGMAITSNNIRVIDVVKNTGGDDGFTLTCFQDIPLVNPDPFHPDNAAPVNEVIKKFGLKVRTVNILAIDPSLIIRRVETQIMPREEMVESLRIVEQDQVSYPLESAALDVMPFPTSREQGEVPALMAVIDGEAAKRYHDFVNLTGFKHAGISIRPTAISALLEHSKILNREDGVPVISIGRDVTGIQFYQDAQLKFQRDVNVGDVDIFSGAVGSYDVDGESVTITVQDVERLKRQFGVPRGPDLVKPGIKGVTGQMFFDKLQPSLDKLATEISRSIDYFKSDQNIFKIPNAYIIGEAALIPNLAEYLQDEIGITFSPYDPFKDFIVAGLEKMGDKAGQGPQYAALLGTAMDDGSKINLLSPSMRYSFSKILPKIAAVAVASLYVVFVLGVDLGVMAYKSGAAKKAADFRAKVVEIGAVDRKIDFLEKDLTAAKGRLASHPQVVGMDVKWQELFSKTGFAMPDDAALDGITIKFGGGRDFAVDGEQYGKEITFVGKVRGNPGKQVGVLQKIAQNMTDSGAFRHTTILSARREAVKDGGEQLSFALAADISRGAETK